MIGPEIRIRIEGAQEASGRVHKFRLKTLQRVREEAQVRARKFKSRVQGEMAAAYTSSEASGRLARSFIYRTQLQSNGIDVQFYIGGFRELQYVTALGGGYFTLFPVGPYPIFPRNPNGWLRIAFRDGLVYTKAVMWGSQTGGFERDVLSEVANEEGAEFQADMMKILDDAVVELTVE